MSGALCKSIFHGCEEYFVVQSTCPWTEIDRHFQSMENCTRNGETGMNLTNFLLAIS